MLTGIQSNARLRILIVEHTNKSADNAFGCVKQRLRERDVVRPVDLMNVAEYYSAANRCIPGVDVTWRRWKELLSFSFGMPAFSHIEE